VPRTNVEQQLRSLTARRIAIIKPSALGDVVQALPLLPALRQRFPNASLTWVIQRELADLVAGHPHLDQMLTFDRRPNWWSVPSFLAALRRQRFDLVLDLQGLLRSAVMVVATGAKWRVGLETAREGAGLVANLTIPDSGWNVPAHARNWRVAEALGVGDVPRQTIVHVSPHDQAIVDGWLRGMPRPVFAVQWGARWETKRWPLDKMTDVMLQAAREWGGSTAFIGGPGERAACDAACARMKNAVACNLAGRTTLKQLAALLMRVDAVLANDSGPMHLAAELGTPVVGVFTCTSPVRSGPPGVQHQFVASELPCAASYHKQCPLVGVRRLACHSELASARVWQALQKLVERNNLLAKTRAA